MTTTKGALEGVRVLDISRVLAGPFAAQLLADLGADVIKVERPIVGDDARNFGEPYLRDEAGRRTRENAFYLSANRNKRSMTVNISTEEGQRIVRDLASRADVLIENYKVGDLARYGLDYQTLRELNPRLIYCSITGYGQSGPYRGKPGYDAVFQAQSGLMSVTGDPDGMPGGGPMKVGPSIIDVITALYASNAIQAALYHRDAAGGSGQHLDLALLDCAIAALSHYAQIFLTSGEIPQRRGTQGNGGMPSALFQCSDGSIMLTAGNDLQFRRLCEALDRPELADDERFHTNLGRVDNRYELTELLDGIFRTDTVARWLAKLEAAAIPSGALNDIAEMFDDPHVLHRELAVSTPHSWSQDLKAIRSPMRFSETTIDCYSAAPVLGQHTLEVLEGELGMGAEEIRHLRRLGVV